MGCNASKSAEAATSVVKGTAEKATSAVKGTADKATSAVKGTADNVGQVLQGGWQVLGTGGQILGKGGHHVKNIFAKPLQELLGSTPYQPPVFPKTDEQKKFLKKALQGSLIFEGLEASNLDPLVSAMELVEFEPKQNIIQQGDVGDYFYVIDDGAVEFIVNGKKVGSAERGDSFGELSLLYSAPRAATVQAASSQQVRVFRVDQKTFRYILQQDSQQANKNKMELLGQVTFLKDLDEYSLHKLAHVMELRTFQNKQIIFKKGETQAELFFILETGSVKVTDIEAGKTSYEDIVLNKAGDYFGERALVTGEPRAATVTCVSETATFYTIDKETFEKVLGDFKTAILKTGDKRKLSAVKIIADSNLNQHTLTAMSQMIREVTYAKGTILCTAGNSTEATLTFVRTGGSVTLTNKDGSTLKKVEADGYFGEDQLLADVNLGKEYSLNAPCRTKPAYTATCTEATPCGILKLADLRKLMDTRLIGQPAAAVQHSTKEKDLQLKELNRHKILGEGTFGQVWLVSRKTSTGEQVNYALKIQSKYDLIEQGQAKAVMEEKNIMAKLEHPFLIGLVNSYQDDGFVYILLQLIQGGELYSAIFTDKHDHLANEDARFYGACVAEGLGYMHRCGFIYRDLKPENVLIDKEGYCVIIDFGFAKYCPAPSKTFTLCGTPLYLAPEVIMNRGHNASADHWSLGVLIFEMLTGKTPFYEDGMDQMDLFRSIIQGKPIFPTSIEPAAKHVMNALLMKQPSQRLGSLAGGEDAILAEEWFQLINFDELRAKTIKPPMVPPIKDPQDTSNFEDLRHLKDKSKQIYPKLSPSEQKAFEGF